MFVRICLLSVLAMGAFAGPASSDDSGITRGAAEGDRPLVMAIRIPKIHIPRPPPPPTFPRCGGWGGRC